MFSNNIKTEVAIFPIQPIDASLGLSVFSDLITKRGTCFFFLYLSLNIDKKNLKRRIRADYENVAECRLVPLTMFSRSLSVKWPG